MTVREAIKTYRGDFYNALVRAYDCGTTGEFLEAYGRADRRHGALLEQAFPRIEETPVTKATIRAGLIAAFPGLAHLDDETDDPTDFDLATDWEERP